MGPGLGRRLRLVRGASGRGGYRGGDAVNWIAGLYYNNWIAGGSYDLNFSELTVASFARGGLEFQLQYILKLFKPKVVQYRVCPDYM